MQKLVAQNSFVKTWFYPESKLLVSEYAGRSNLAKGMAHLAEVVAFYQKQQVSYSIVDIRLIYGSFAKGLEFLRETYYPEAKKSGLVCQAIVVPDDVIVETLATKMAELGRQFIGHVQVFKSRIKAEEWIVNYK